MRWARISNGTAARLQRQKVRSSGVMEALAACPTTKLPDQNKVASTRQSGAFTA